MTHDSLIANMLVATAGKKFQENNWGARHCAAWREPQPNEEGVVNLLKAAAVYADNHRKRFESGVGEDGFLGQHWVGIVKAVRVLLNGDCGRLDCGTLDKLILEMLEIEGSKDE
jgi:hypothetical protein